jgi:hydroxycarboxylate dehydrogenase B
MAADAGQLSLHFVGTTGIGALMVPFGGTDRRLSLRVVAAGIPRRKGPPLIYDIATFGSAPAALAATRRPARQPVARLRTA